MSTERVRALNRAPVRRDGEYVLYWMIATRRLPWSYSLDRAVEHATRLSKPLLIFEPLNAGYRWASDRSHQAIVDGENHSHSSSRTGLERHPRF